MPITVNAAGEINKLGVWSLFFLFSFFFISWLLIKYFNACTFNSSILKKTVKLCCSLIFPFWFCTSLQKKIPCNKGDSNQRQYCALAFQTLYQLCYYHTMCWWSLLGSFVCEDPRSLASSMIQITWFAFKVTVSVSDGLYGSCYGIICCQL